MENFISRNQNSREQFIVGNDTDQLSVNLESLLWQRQDQLGSSSLSESILILMVGLSISREIWEALEVNFSSQSKARLMQYKLQLQTLKKGSSPMREYLNKIKTCYDLLALAGQRISEEDQVLHILASLGPEYDPMIVTITSKADIGSVKDVQALLLSFEFRMEAVATT